jgi:hypothetical protein
MSNRKHAWAALLEAPTGLADREWEILRENVERACIEDFMNEFFSEIDDLTSILAIEPRTALGAELVLRELNKVLDNYRS